MLTTPLLRHHGFDEEKVRELLSAMGFSEPTRRHVIALEAYLVKRLLEDAGYGATIRWSVKEA